VTRRRQPAGPSAVELARQVAEAVRGLNHATHPADRFPGLEYPADAYEVLGALSTAAGGLGQTIGQLARFLRTQNTRPGLSDYSATYSGRPAVAIAYALAALDDTLGPLALVARFLNEAQRATSGLAVDETDTDEPGEVLR
jgi:hypothetical protein